MLLRPLRGVTIGVSIGSEPLTDVWRTSDRLRTDDATRTLLIALAKTDDAIGEVITGLEAAAPGNGSVWASGKARIDGTSALLKLGARASEREWMTAIHAAGTDVVPRVFGSGEIRGVGWLVLERCDMVLDRVSPSDVAAVVSAAARWQRAATAIDAAAPVMDSAELHETLDAAASMSCPGDVDRLIDRLDRTWELVASECGLTPTHGDVHTANAVARHATGPALLVDPMPMTTVWPWDAAYLQAVLAPHQRFDHGSRGDGLVHVLARERRSIGLSAREGQLDRIERVVLAWAAAAWWRMAPWRHESPDWRGWVEDTVNAAV